MITHWISDLPRNGRLRLAIGDKDFTLIGA
jgi:hypothetical protein